MINEWGFVYCDECGKRVTTKHRGQSPTKYKTHFCNNRCKAEYMRNNIEQFRAKKLLKTTNEKKKKEIVC